MRLANRNWSLLSLSLLLALGADRPAAAVEPCVESPTVVCLGNGRYRLSATYLAPGASGVPVAAHGFALPTGSQPGSFGAAFWFVDATTIDLRVGVVERCAPSTPPASVEGIDVTVAATTQNAFTVRVEDLATVVQRTLSRKVGAARGTLRADAAFACLEPNS